MSFKARLEAAVVRDLLITSTGACILRTLYGDHWERVARFSQDVRNRSSLKWIFSYLGGGLRALLCSHAKRVEFLETRVGRAGVKILP